MQLQDEDWLREVANLCETPRFHCIHGPTVGHKHTRSITRSPQISRTHLQTQEVQIIISVATPFLII